MLHTRTTLELVTAYRKSNNTGGKGPGYKPKVTRDQLLSFSWDLMRARSLAEAAAMTQEFTQGLPSTPPIVHPRTGRLFQPANWRTSFVRLANAFKQEKPLYPVFTTDGNVKLQDRERSVPIACFSTLPIITCPGAGSCADDETCYSLTSWRYPAPYCRQAQNTLLLRFAPQTIEDAFWNIPDEYLLRLYVDGDFKDTRTVRFWMRLFKRRRSMRAFGYSKSWDLLVAYGRHYRWPSNYLLNLSSGVSRQRATPAEMMALPITRGWFVSPQVTYRPAGKTGNIGFERYDDPAYHQAVREAAARDGFGRVFSCTGICHRCASGQVACASERFRGVVIANGLH